MARSAHVTQEHKSPRMHDIKKNIMMCGLTLGLVDRDVTAMHKSVGSNFGLTNVFSCLNKYCTVRIDTCECNGVCEFHTYSGQLF